jgi:hypothetical protein
MDWWTMAEGGEGTDSDEDDSEGGEEGEGRQDAKKPKGTGQVTQQGQDSEVSKTGGGRQGRGRQSKSGGMRENGGAQEDGVASQQREDMQMYAMICGMFRSSSSPSDGGAAVAGVDLARAMPRALGANIREALDRLEQENKVMVDGPNEGLEGVMVYEIVDDAGDNREREGGKSGKRQAARPLLRGAGPQRAIYGDNYTVEWQKQKRGKESRGDGL